MQQVWKDLDLDCSRYDDYVDRTVYRHDVLDGDGTLMGCIETADGGQTWQACKWYSFDEMFAAIDAFEPSASISDNAELVYREAGGTGRWTKCTMIEVPLFDMVGLTPFFRSIRYVRFAFFVNGENEATITGEDGTETFVSINNINADQNAQYFRDNDYVSGGTSPYDTGLNGMTTVLGFEAEVNAGETNTLKLAIADVSDTIYDSTVMIEAGTFSSPANIPPVAEDQNLETGVDEPLDIALVATDEDEDELTYTVNDEGLNGTLEGDGANWTFTPEEGFEGSTSFTVTANDGEYDSNTATVTIQVGEVQNTPPVADDQDVETDFNTPADITLTGSDADEDDLTFDVVDTDDLAGELEGDGANVTFTPEEGFSGTTSFTYVANDGEADSEPATVTITVAEEVIVEPTETPAPSETPSAEPTETPTTSAPTETADPSETADPVEDEETAEEASDEKLSDTGSSAAILAIGGVLLVAAGAGLLYMRRRAAN